MTPAVAAMLLALGCVGSDVRQDDATIATVWVCPAPAPAAEPDEPGAPPPGHPRLGGPMPSAPPKNPIRRG